MEGDQDFLESVLTEYKQRYQHAVVSDVDASDLYSEPELTSHDVIGPIASNKRKAPTKPRRKASSSQSTANFLGDLDLGDPVNIQEIMDTVRAKNETALHEGGSVTHEYNDADSSENTSINSHQSVSRELSIDKENKATFNSSSNEITSDQHIYSDPDHTFTVDLIPPTLPSRSNQQRSNSSCALDRINSMEDISCIGENDCVAPKLGSGRMKASASVQSNLDLIGTESSSPAKRLGRFGSRRSRDRGNPSDKDFGHILDAAASNASSAYAKLRQLKNKAKKDILGSKPGKGQVKTVRDFDGETRRKSHSKSDLTPFTTAENGWARTDADKPLKSGWLKKQGGMRKTWSDRWFVLTKKCLYFYKDRDEAKLCGSIPIAGCEVDENPNISEGSASRYAFEIIPEFGKRNQNSQTFAAATKNDKDSWIKAVNKVKSGPAAAGIFGQSLSYTVQREERIADGVQGKRESGRVPFVVIKCCEFIRENKGFAEEGLFRLPGHADDVQEFRDAFDKGQIPTFDSHTDVHTIASLLKSYLRELPEPVVPFRMYSTLIESAQKMMAAEQLAKTSTNGVGNEIVDVIKPHLEQLPEENLHLLGYLSRFLDEVQRHSSKNKMDIGNLALMFGPNILRSDDLDPVSMISHSTYVQYVMSQFITNHDLYFAEIKTSTSIPDVAADADRQDVNNRVNENNLINVMKSGLPIIGSSHPGNGTPVCNTPKRSSPNKPLRLGDHANRPVLPPKPSVKQDSFDRFEGVDRSFSGNSNGSYIPNGVNTRPASSCSSYDGQGMLSSKHYSADISKHSSVEDMISNENLSSNTSSPRNSGSEYVQDKVPRPPARRRKSAKDSPLRPASAGGLLSSAEVFERDSTVTQTMRSFPGSRTASVSSGTDSSAQRERSRSAATGPRKPKVRPPPPPLVQKRPSGHEPTYDELKDTVKLLKDKLFRQRNEFHERLQYFEDDFVGRMRELKSHPLIGLEDLDQESSDLKSHAANKLSRRSGEFATDKEELEALRESVKEERRLRFIAEVQLRNEKWGREVAEQRNAQILRDLERVRGRDST